MPSPSASSAAGGSTRCGARTPKHWPASFVEFVRGWRQDKVLWATDDPLLSFERTLDELEALGLPAEVLRKVVRDNAGRAFGVGS